MADVELEKIGEVIARVTAAEGLELVHWELKGYGGAKPNALLRVTIDRPQGITHSDCVAVDNQVSSSLDADDIIPFPYTLEVSSPGLGRALTGQPDFDRHRGQVARIRAKEPIDGRVSFKGRVDHVTPREVTLVDNEGQGFTIPYSNILAANVVQVPKGVRRAEVGEETSDE